MLFINCAQPCHARAHVRETLTPQCDVTVTATGANSADGPGASLNTNHPNTPMNLDALKGKTLDDALFTQLAAHVEGLATRAETAEGKARTAQKESIEGRHKLKAERDAAFEKLGVATAEELEALEAPKGQAEAIKQLDAKVKRAERERAEALAQLQEVNGKYAADRRALAVEKALSAHPFVDMDDARAVFERSVQAEGDELLFKTAEGKLVPLQDGATWLAKTKTHLVRAPAAGQQGSGFKGGASGSAGVKNPWAKDSFNLTEQVRLTREDPTTAAAFKAAATA